MDLLVFSDSHGIAGRMETVLNRWKVMPEYAVHLGDGNAEFEALAARYAHTRTVFTWVAGNGEDYTVSAALRAPAGRVLTFGPYRFFLCHGHRLGVKSGTDPLIPFARDNGYDAILFGHTHEAYHEVISAEEMRRDRPLHLFNPGSISYPSNGTPSFGVVTEVGGVLLFSHGTV